jgi:hypothetical protein
MRRGDLVAVFGLCVLALALVGARAWRAADQDGGILPRHHHRLELRMTLVGVGQDIALRAALPSSSPRQRITGEMVSSGELVYSVDREPGLRLGEWEGRSVEGEHAVVYSATVRTFSQRFELAPDLRLSDHHPEHLERHLQPGPAVQSDAPEIRALLARIAPAAGSESLTSTLRRLFEFARDEIAPAGFTGTTDALTCLRLGEASCGGKSRLLVALARAAGIPARLVGGVILREGQWRSTHVWTEVWVQGHWVPMCPLNDHFASVPESYLAIYRGEHPLITHSPDINFRYHFESRRVLAPPSAWARSARLPVITPLSSWELFERFQVPVDLLKVVLMLPFGILVVVLARNVVGIETFGTFVPALLAVAFGETGLVTGMLLFAVIVLCGTGVRAVLERFHLLQAPRLAVVLTAVVAVMLLIALAGAATGTVIPSWISLFPLAILTMVIERVTVTLEEEGPATVLRLAAGTGVVVLGSYAVMQSEWLQLAVITFPELLLFAVAGFVIAGRWLGMRLSELVRFRVALSEPRATS